MENSIKKQHENKDNEQRYKYEVETTKANEEVIEFVPLNATLIDRTKLNNGGTKKPRKTNLKIISQYLTIDPVGKKNC